MRIIGFIPVRAGTGEGLGLVPVPRSARRLRIPKRCKAPCDEREREDAGVFLGCLMCMCSLVGLHVRIITWQEQGSMLSIGDKVKTATVRVVFFFREKRSGGCAPQ